MKDVVVGGNMFEFIACSLVLSFFRKFLYYLIGSLYFLPIKIVCPFKYSNFSYKLSKNNDFLY